MNKSDILWSQKANTRTGTLRHFASFLYEFVGARFTILAFFGLFNIAAFGLQYYGFMLAGGIALFLYYVISDAFDVFWTGINLEYFVTKHNLVFRWGILSLHELKIPLEKITKLTAISDKRNKRSALAIEHIDQFKNADYNFSKEQYFRQLTFENIEYMDSLIGVLDGVYNGAIEVQPTAENVDWVKKLPTSTFYLKSLHLIGFILFYFATSIGLKLIDNNFLYTETIQDLAVEQVMFTIGGEPVSNTITTQQGYKMKLSGNTQFISEQIKFDVSPIFKDVTDFHSYKSANIRPLINGYQGLNFFFKLVVMISSLLSGWYIFYKKAEIPFMDLSILIGLPALWAFVAYYLYG